MSQVASPAGRRQAGGEGPADGALDRGLLSAGVGPSLRLLRNLLTARVVMALAPFGLKSGALSILTMISANPGCSQSDLARELALDKSDVVVVVDELESMGLAVRTRCARDRRRHVLSLTPEGEALMRRMHAAVSRVEVPIRDALSPEERDQFLSLLSRAHRALLRRS